MKDRNSSDQRTYEVSGRPRPKAKAHKRPVSFKSVQNKQSDGTYYIKNKFKKINAFFSNSVKDIYNSLWMTFSFDQADFRNFKRFLRPVISSASAFIIGEYITSQLRQTTGQFVGGYLSASMGRDLSENDNYDHMFKFLIGTAILLYAAAHRVTEQRPKSSRQMSAMIATEVLGITYLYTSTFQGSRLLLENHLSDNYSLIASIGASTLAVPGSFSYLVQKGQEYFDKKKYRAGSQRSDTALVSAGATPISNTYFQMNRLVFSEMTASRLFQLLLISDNILNANKEPLTVFKKKLKQLRNVPAYLADKGPPILKKLAIHQTKLAHDHKHNTTPQRVLRFTKENKPEFINIARYKLKNGDLVKCSDEEFSESSPVSGKVVALKQDANGNYIQEFDIQKFSINLKAHNGEDIWIEHKTHLHPLNENEQVDLHAIHEGKQAGVLAGAKLNLYGKNNFFIQIKDEKERTLSSNYEKKAVINQIITEYKQRNVMLAGLFSASMALGLTLLDTIPRGTLTLSAWPLLTVKLLFNLFQMMIPFSESFLREMVNSRLMKDLNQHLGENHLETIDALRIVDFCNAMDGYYSKRFAKGVVIVSDKTGTLTTSKMNVLGIWTTNMAPHVQNLLAEEKSYLLPERDKQLNCYDAFINAYTNSKKDLEPEEFAIMHFFNDLLATKNIAIDTLGNNHFRKTYLLDKSEKTIQTYHLGLYRALGGRFTLVDEEKRKYLVFCGVPRFDKFGDTSLFKSYSNMTNRTGVLSRDWCLARTEISDEAFNDLLNLFSEDKKQEIEILLCTQPDILNKLVHYGTFIIDNPVKKAAEKFISQCAAVQVPVFVATGDTAKAAENIAKVLCPANISQIVTIRPQNLSERRGQNFTKDSTVIFAGINDEILEFFTQLMNIRQSERPVIIFSEMSTEGKGILSGHLKNQGFFVVANGDGTNDVAMMKNANFVIAHLTDDGNYAPGVAQFTNLNDMQLKTILGAENGSFYEDFDFHQPESVFKKLFTPLANTQEKPSIALLLKSSKMSFELAQMVGAPNVKEMWQQHWFSVGFDLAWLGIAFNEIKNSTDLPFDNKNLGESNQATRYMLMTFALAATQALVTYAMTGESTNVNWMVLMLSTLPIVLKSIFASFGHVQEELHPVVPALEAPEEKSNAVVGKQRFGLFKTCFRKKNKNGNQFVEQPKEREMKAIEMRA